MYKILIVDDDPTSLAIGRALLEKDYQVTLARSGIQALGFLRGGELPDVILLDMVMPGVDGMAVLKELKESKILQGIPVIFLTGEDSVDEEVRCYENGAADFLQKPVNPKLLRIKLKQQFHFLGLKRENKQLRAVLKLMRDQLELIFPEGSAEEP